MVGSAPYGWGWPWLTSSNCRIPQMSLIWAELKKQYVRGSQDYVGRGIFPERKTSFSGWLRGGDLWAFGSWRVDVSMPWKKVHQQKTQLYEQKNTINTTPVPKGHLHQDPKSVARANLGGETAPQRGRYPGCSSNAAAQVWGSFQTTRSDLASFRPTARRTSQLRLSIATAMVQRPPLFLAPLLGTGNNPPAFVPSSSIPWCGSTQHALPSERQRHSLVNGTAASKRSCEVVSSLLRPARLGEIGKMLAWHFAAVKIEDSHQPTTPPPSAGLPFLFAFVPLVPIVLVSLAKILSSWNNLG